MKITPISKQTLNKQLYKVASDDIFQNKVDVSLYIRMTDLERKEFDYDLVDRQVLVSFVIDADWRNWGLKNAYIFIKNIDPIQVSITRYDSVTGDDREVKMINVIIDPRKIKTDKFQGQISSVTVGNLELTIDINGVVNYDESSIDVYEI